MRTTLSSMPRHAPAAGSSVAQRGRQLGFVALLTTLGVVGACNGGKTDARKTDSAAGASAAAMDSATRARTGTTPEGMTGEHGGMEMRDSARMRERRP